MYSKTVLVGRLGKDPEARNTTSGTSVVTLSVATESRYKDNDGGWQSRTEWHKVALFGKRADWIAEHAKKGSLVFIEGKNQTRSWEKEGQKHYATEVVADEVKLLDGKGDAGGDRPESGQQQTRGTSSSPRTAAQSRPVTQTDPISDDDIPF